MRALKVLVVEDFVQFRQFTCSLLRERAECRLVGEVGDGLEAVQKIEELRPDLILLDIGLPKLNGIKVAERARKIVPDAKLLFVSQESSNDVIEETFRVGGHGYILKEHAGRDLLPAIEAMLRGGHFVSRGLELDLANTPDARCRHEIAFCGNEEVLLDRLADFIGEALNGNDAAIVWATESHRRILIDRLRAHSVRIDLAIQRGTYISSDVSETADRVQLLEVLTGLREAARCAGAKHPRIAVCGERAGRLWADGKFDEALRLEQLWEELGVMQGDLDIFCVYPAVPADKDDQALKSICAEHTDVYSR